MERIAELRKLIDDIDDKILGLINERANLASNIGQRKKKTKAAHHVPERELEVLKRVQALNNGPVGRDAVRNIFKEIISACRAMEGELKVGYLGPEATFSHMASIRQFGSSSTFFPYKTIRDIFNAVSAGKIDYGVVPVENSNEGAVGSTLDMFVETNLNISAELSIPISHFLLSKSGKKEDIKKIYSHPQPLSQCREWLSNFFPDIPLLESPSTAIAAKLCITEDDAAAVAGELAREIYGLKEVAAHIEDNPNNFTRFFIISNETGQLTGKDKTSLLFSIEDKPGALCNILHILSDYRINMTRIESRPSKKKPWEYLFFIDIKGHMEEETVKIAIKKLENNTNLLKILGSYPSE